MIGWFQKHLVDKITHMPQLEHRIFLSQITVYIFICLNMISFSKVLSIALAKHHANDDTSMVSEIVKDV